MSRQTTGEFLSLLRKAAGYTQEDVAEKLNVSNKTVSSWETDRTMPDVLLLPAIADLYGVTVDEILHGERAQKEISANNEIAAQSIKALRKNRFGKFSSRCNLFCGSACIFAALIFIACILSLYQMEEWVLILFFVLGFIGFAVCIIVTLYFANNVKVAEGVVFKEDFTEENKTLAFAISQKIWRFFAVCTIPFALFTLFFIIVSLIKGFKWELFINAAPLAALMLSSALYRMYGIERYADDGIKRTVTSNNRILLKLCGIGALPFAALIVAFVATMYSLDAKILLKSENFQEFTNIIHTLTVDDGGELDGEYLLKFPDEPIPNYEYDLGCGFKGMKKFNKWLIYVKGNDKGVDLYSKEFVIYQLDGSSLKREIVNIKFAEYDSNIFYCSPQFYCDENYNYWLTARYSDLVYILGSCLLLFAVATEITVLSVIYHYKREKVKIAF